jgi:tetratricopeptide (TPR) repeat protein
MEALRISRSSCSLHLGCLERAGLLSKQLGHVPGRPRRVNAHYLTKEGLETALEFAEILSKRMVTMKDPDGTTTRLRLDEMRLKLDLPLYRLVHQLQNIMLEDGQSIVPEEEGVGGHRAARGYLRTLKVSGATGVSGAASLAAAVQVARFFPPGATFIDREDELERILEALADGTSALVHGLAGVGKTALLREVYDHFKGKDWHLLWHTIHPWDTAETLIEVLCELLDGLGAVELSSAYLHQERKEPLRFLPRVLSFLGTGGYGNLLLIFDDLHLAGESSSMVLDGLLHQIMASPELHLILGSREATSLFDRKAVVDGRLVELNLKGLGQDHTEELLAGRGMEADMDRLHRITQGHPLALKVLSRSAHDPKKELEHYIQEEILDPLDRRQRTILDNLSQFIYPPDPRAALLDDATLDDLLGLERRSLVERNPDGALVVNEMVRDLIERSLGTGTVTEIHRRIADLLDAARTAASELGSMDLYGLTAEEFTCELVYHLAKAGEIERAATIIEAYGEDLVDRGFTELAHCLEIINLELVDRVELELSAGLVPLLLGRVYLAWGWKDRARIVLTRWLEREVDHPFNHSRTHSLLAEIAASEEDIGELEGQLELAIETLTGGEEGALLHQANAFIHIARVALRADDTERALIYCEKALILYKEQDHLPGHVAALNNLGLIQLMLGDATQAQENIEKGLELARGADQKKEVARSLHQLGMLHLHEGRDLESLVALEESDLAHQEASDPMGHCLVLIELVRAHLKHGDDSEASELHARAARLARKHSFHELLQELDEIEV